MNNEYLSEDYGLINSHKNIPHSEENSPLWTVQYILRQPTLPHLTINSLENFVFHCERRKPGLYDQRPFKSVNPKDDYMSPDQLIAFVAFFYITGDKEEIDKIWKYLKSHFFTYDNLTGKTNFKRTMQPLAIAFVGACVGSWFWKKVLKIACKVAFKAPLKKTSGKLKAWVCLKTLDMQYDLVKSNVNFDFAFNYYFNTYGNRPDHPNVRGHSYQ